jgi:hypothetical protein
VLVLVLVLLLLLVAGVPPLSCGSSRQFSLMLVAGLRQLLLGCFVAGLSLLPVLLLVGGLAFAADLTPAPQLTLVAQTDRTAAL